MDVNLPEELIDAYLDGELDEAGGERLNAWLEADAGNVRAFVRRVFVHHQLRESLLAQNVNQTLSAQIESEGDALAVVGAPSESVWGQTLYGRRGALIAAALVGVAVGSLFTWRLMGERAGRQPIGPPLAIQAQPDADDYVATLVNVNNCRWDKVRSTANLQIGSTLRPGESLHLLEGVAQIQTMASRGATAVQLEGPAAMTLTSAGMPSLLYGKLTASFSSTFDQFALDTPLGRVIVSSNASIGVTSAPNHVELHVFSGTATLELWTMGIDSASEQLTAASGTSLRAKVADDGRVSIDHGEARESWFLTPAAIAESRLEISDQYVELIRQARPVAYWRFEESDDAVIRNEMGDRLHVRMVGDAVRWRPGPDGGAVEFGVSAGPGYLISDDTLDGVLTESYTLETWAKPSYYHHGALFSLIQWTPSQSPLGAHRMHLELCGPVSGFPVPYRPNEANPGRIRFIQQCNTKFDVECFSTAPYLVRKWQHIAAVKDPSAMRLYVNGERVDSKEAQGTLESGLRILMGQLFPNSPKVDDEVTSRLYGGELDEVALYDRPLTAEELRQRVKSAMHDNQSESAVSDDSF